MANNDKRDTKKMQQEHGDESPAPGPGKEPGVALPAEARGQIGKQLRQVYGEMLSEPIPDKFSELLARLSKSEQGQ